MRADNFGHGPLDFCHVTANSLARVPKNLGGPRPPLEVVPARLKMGPRAQTRKTLVPRAFGQMSDHESEGSGVDQQRQSLRKKNVWWQQNRGKMWAKEATDTLLDL